jgi:hypothetical protein
VGSPDLVVSERREALAHHNLGDYLDAYIEAAGIRYDGKTALFRSGAGRTGASTEMPMNRFEEAYLEARGALENAQALTSHESRARKALRPHWR